MYTILPISKKQIQYLKKRKLWTKWEKVKVLLAQNPGHPSLNFEKIILKSNSIYSFRLDKKYRGLCFFKQLSTIEVFAFTNHYQ